MLYLHGVEIKPHAKPQRRKRKQQFSHRVHRGHREDTRCAQKQRGTHERKEPGNLDSFSLRVPLLRMLRIWTPASQGFRAHKKGGGRPHFKGNVNPYNLRNLWINGPCAPCIARISRRGRENEGRKVFSLFHHSSIPFSILPVELSKAW